MRQSKNISGYNDARVDKCGPCITSGGDARYVLANASSSALEVLPTERNAVITDSVLVLTGRRAR